MPTSVRLFWSETPTAARPALIATVLLAALSLITFAGTIAVISIGSGVSVGTAVFGPLPGNPMIVFVYYALPAILLQGLVALALRQNSPGLRIIGFLGGLAVAALCAVWLVFVGLDVIRWLTTGFVNDVGDLAGEIVAIPLALAIGGLNARAAHLSFADFRYHHGPGSPFVIR